MLEAHGLAVAVRQDRPAAGRTDVANPIYLVAEHRDQVPISLVVRNDASPSRLGSRRSSSVAPVARTGLSRRRGARRAVSSARVRAPFTMHRSMTERKGTQVPKRRGARSFRVQ